MDNMDKQEEKPYSSLPEGVKRLNSLDISKKHYDLLSKQASKEYRTTRAHILYILGVIAENDIDVHTLISLTQAKANV